MVLVATGAFLGAQDTWAVHIDKLSKAYRTAWKATLQVSNNTATSSSPATHISPLVKPGDQSKTTTFELASGNPLKAKLLDTQDV